MDIDKLIKQLRSAAKLEAYYNSEYNGLYNQAADALEKLQAELQKSEHDNVNLTGELAKVAAELEQAKAERDAAIEDIKGDCEKCIHFHITWNGCTPDFECPLSDQCLNRDMWQWRGLQRED